MSTPGPGARQLAEMFHDRYERLAPQFGYATRKETRAFDPASPNGRLMIAVCDEILTWFDANDAGLCVRCASLLKALEGRHTLDCELVKHHNSTRCTCSLSGVVQ